jgi:hypothetical protein
VRQQTGSTVMRGGRRKRTAAHPAYETPEELELKRKRQSPAGPVYDRAALQLTAGSVRISGGGRKPHWLLCWSGVVWTTSCAGGNMSMPLRPTCAGQGRRQLPLHVPSVVDDIDLRITHVIAARTMWPTPPKIRCSRLWVPPPAFGHRISWSAPTARRGPNATARSPSPPAGEDAGQASYSALIAPQDPVAPHANLDELARSFDFAVARAGALRSERGAPAQREPCTCCRSARSGTDSPRWGRGREEFCGEAWRRGFPPAQRRKALVARGRGAARPRDRRTAISVARRQACFPPSGTKGTWPAVFGRQGGDRGQGQGAVLAAPAAHGARAWAQTSNCCR